MLSVTQSPEESNGEFTVIPRAQFWDSRYGSSRVKVNLQLEEEEEVEAVGTNRTREEEPFYKCLARRRRR